MNTKEIISSLKLKHGKQYKQLFTDKLHSKWVPSTDFTPMIQEILKELGIDLGDTKLNSNTANAIACKLDLKF